MLIIIRFRSDNIVGIKASRLYFIVALEKVLCAQTVSVTVMAVLFLSDIIKSPRISSRIKTCQTSVSEMKFVETPSPMEYKVNHPHKRYTGDFLLSAARRHFFKKRNKDSINSESLSDQTLSDANCCTDSRLYSYLTSKSLFFQFLCAALKHFFFEKFLDNMHIFTWKFEN